MEVRIEGLFFRGNIVKRDCPLGKKGKKTKTKTMNEIRTISIGLLAPKTFNLGSEIRISS